MMPNRSLFIITIFKILQYVWYLQIKNAWNCSTTWSKWSGKDYCLQSIHTKPGMPVCQQTHSGKSMYMATRKSHGIEKKSNWIFFYYYLYEYLKTTQLPS